jgi:peptidoglycan hydrolase-like protein with peptidoglycan-binding domain
MNNYFLLVGHLRFGYTSRNVPLRILINEVLKDVLRMRFVLALLIGAGTLSSSAYASRVHRSPTSGQATHHSRTVTTKKYHRTRGQQGIEPDRVMQIQQALIREHYLNGAATGKWDSTTVAAMQKYQSDQGWQTKLMPDSRALKKLGLGPDYSSALNAKDSSFSAPPPASTIPAQQESGFTAASGARQ